MNVSLGGLIKYYRIKKRLSQLDIAAALGWKDTSRLSKLEQERSGAPTRQTVEKIANVLGLDEIEKNEFFYAANIPPTDEEVQKMTKEIRGFIEKWPNPAYILDSFWRIVDFNGSFSTLFGIDRTLVNRIRKEKPNLLELFFNSNFLLKNLVRDWKDKKWIEFIENTIAQFKIEHHGQLGQSWIKALARNLSRSPLFREYWENISSATVQPGLDHYNFVQLKLKNNGHTKVQSFYLFTTTYWKDRRFDVVLFTQAKG